MLIMSIVLIWKWVEPKPHFLKIFFFLPSLSLFLWVFSAVASLSVTSAVNHRHAARSSNERASSLYKHVGHCSKPDANITCKSFNFHFTVTNPFLLYCWNYTTCSRHWLWFLLGDRLSLRFFVSQSGNILSNNCAFPFCFLGDFS